MTTKEIEDGIERTRGAMASTLSAIEHRLSPRQIMDQAVDTMRDIANDRSRVGAMVRDNPVPLALIGVGIGWLALSGTLSQSRQGTSGSYESLEGAAEWGGEATTAMASQYTDEARAAAGVSAKARDAAARAGDRLNRWSHDAKVQASHAADRTRDTYREHPLTMGLVAVLAGAAIGALLPRSQAESEMLGDVDIAGKAREAGQQLVDKAERVAERAVHGAKEEGGKALREEGAATRPGSSLTH
ncbi:DUF3618 domain-containing protein [Magnetospirillum sp. UT-4]|uniref:DUF3618 domain-containing protein n=1 Tax=Magnetospirillum sp. UT-4 TaxID=2681467 RepID=UPI001380CB6C|nr:DUF3618 domain-containing protein [Magnetospirillum sp. UT-4]CAA7619427.1 hypothetical protein MTBUT4_300070 [Magnetospirillum sp. UT-4]